MKWKSMNGAQRFTFFPFAEETRQIEKERLKGVKVNWVGWFGLIDLGGLRAAAAAIAPHKGSEPNTKPTKIKDCELSDEMEWNE